MRSWNSTWNPKVPDGTICLAVTTDDERTVAVDLIRDPVNLNRAQLRMPDAPWPNGPFGANIVATANGWQGKARWTLPAYGRQDIEADMPMNLEPSEVPFPPDIKRPPLPPFDVPEPPDYNPVWTTPPPELLALPAFRDKKKDINFCRGNLWGVTTPEPQLMLGNGTPDYTGMQALGLCTNNGGCTWLAFLLGRLPVDRQNYFLDFYAKERGYTHIAYLGPFITQDLAQRSRQRGLYVHGLCDASLGDPLAQAQEMAPYVDRLIIGFECNDHMSSAEFMTLLPQVKALSDQYHLPKPGIHLTINYRVFPLDGMSQEQSANWAKDYMGVLWWEGNVQRYSVDSAGLMSGHLYDARGFWGNIDPSVLVVPCEVMSERQFFGPGDDPPAYLGGPTWANEDYGDLRGWELLCATRASDNVPPSAGFCNGGRWPDGSVI